MSNKQQLSRVQLLQRKDLSRRRQPVCNHRLSLVILTSNNQRLEKCVRCVLLLYNWDLRVFFFGLASDRGQHEIEAKCVSQSEMAAEASNDLASSVSTRGTS